MLDPQANQTIPDQPDKLISSSSIIGYSYDAHAYTLTVWYHGGSVYRYFLVYPPMVSDVFDKPGSVGNRAFKALRGMQKLKLR